MTGEAVETGGLALHERFRLTYPSGTVVMPFYAGGASLEEVAVTHRMAEVEAVEDSWVSVGLPEAAA